MIPVGRFWSADAEGFGAWAAVSLRPTSDGPEPTGLCSHQSSPSERGCNADDPVLQQCACACVCVQACGLCVHTCAGKLCEPCASCVCVWLFCVCISEIPFTMFSGCRATPHAKWLGFTLGPGTSKF